MRKKGLEILSTVLKRKKICSMFEKHIYNKTHTEEQYMWYIYQVVGLLLQGEPNVLQLIKNDKLGWNSPMYKNVLERIEEHDNYVTIPFEVVDGVVECPKCKGNKTWSVQKQTRSSDEPMTTFSRCVLCNYQWAYSG